MNIMIHGYAMDLSHPKHQTNDYELPRLEIGVDVVQLKGFWYDFRFDQMVEDESDQD